MKRRYDMGFSQGGFSVLQRTPTLTIHSLLLCLLLLQPLSGCSFFFRTQTSSCLWPRWSSPPPTYSIVSMIRFDGSLGLSSLFSFCNATMGHSDELLALGLNPSQENPEKNIDPEDTDISEPLDLGNQKNLTRSSEFPLDSRVANATDSKSEDSVDNIEDECIEVEQKYLPNQLHEDDQQESEQHIQTNEMTTILQEAKTFVRLSQEELLQQGWKLVHSSTSFSLYKRRRLKEGSSAEGPVEYLMIGGFDDISPQAFLNAQIHHRFRKLWDTSTKDMSESRIHMESISSLPSTSVLFEEHRSTKGKPTSSSNEEGDMEVIETYLEPKVTNTLAGRIKKSNDQLYYRTKWPWPLKDRDYLLARRCRIFDDENAMVFISKSVEDTENKYPPIDGVIRVDNYWSYSTFLSKHPVFTYPEDTKEKEKEKEEEIAVSMKQSETAKPSSLLEARLTEEKDPFSLKAISMETISKEDSRQLLERLRSLQTIRSRIRSQLQTSKPFYQHQKIFSTLYQRQLFYKLKSLQSSLSTIVQQITSSLPVHHLTAMTSTTTTPALTKISSNLESSSLSQTDKSQGNNERVESNLPEINEEKSLQRKKKKLIQYRPYPIRNTMYQPGVMFVTLFCDDNKAPLPKSIVDLISSFAEKSVPESIHRLYEIAKQVDHNEIQ